MVNQNAAYSLVYLKVLILIKLNCLFKTFFCHLIIALEDHHLSNLAEDFII